MKATPASGAPALLCSCGELVQRLHPACDWVAFFGADRAMLWASASKYQEIHTALLERVCTRSRPAAAGRKVAGAFFAAWSLFDGNRMLGALCLRTQVDASLSDAEVLGALHKTLRPVLELATQQLQTVRPARRVDVLTERTEELEWLFAVTANMRAGSGETSALEHLLEAAAERMEASFAGLAIPEKRFNYTHLQDSACAAHLGIYQQVHPHLMSYVQRQKRPLLINNPPPDRAELSTVKVLALPVLGRGGQVLGLIVFLRPSNAAEFGRRHSYLARHIAHQAGALLDTQYDLATGLLNRAALEKRVQQLVHASVDSTSHAVVHVDIDRLHYVNETFGFDVGDEVIVRVADLLQPPHVPSDAITARIGGDKFAVFLPNHDAAQAQDCATQLQRQASNIPVGSQLQKSIVSLSCGIAKLTQDQDFSRTLAAAELACKTAKDRGRNRSEVYLDIDESMMRRRSDFSGVARLREALDNNRLRVFAQKIVPMADRGRASGMECLVRFVGDDGSVIPPAAFISAAQRFNMWRQLDEWVIHSTLELLRPHASLLFHGGLYVSINISGPSLHDESFVEQVSDWVRQSQVAPGLITFEITETAAVSNLPRLDVLMKKLRQIGCRFALDDFGTGVNSLAYLKNLHVDRVKIDGSFVRDLLTNQRSEAMVRAVVQLARSLEIDCVGEFVENEQLFKKLRDIGVNYAQGYFVHEPEPLEDLLKSLATEESRRVDRLNLEI